VSLVLSVTHIASAVALVLLSVSLVSAALGSVGRAPWLEDLSRGLLAVIGAWMLWQALRRNTHRHDARTGLLVGLIAGLVPCPLTLFVMTFAVGRGVPEAGLVFAGTMVLGVATTLAAVAILAIVARQRLAQILATRPALLERVSGALGAIAGVALIVLGVNELLTR